MHPPLPQPPVYITASDLPAALQARGFPCTARQAQSIVTSRKYPFFKNPVGRGLVISAKALDAAIKADELDGHRTWSAHKEAERRRAAGNAPATRKAKASRR